MKKILILLAIVAVLAPEAQACGKRRAKRAARRAACAPVRCGGGYASPSPQAHYYSTMPAPPH